MDRIEMENLKDKIKKYEKLENKIYELSSILKLPEYVDNKYNGQEKVRIELNITYGNGSDNHKFEVIKNSELGKIIFDNLIAEKERLEKEINEL